MSQSEQPMAPQEHSMQGDEETPPSASPETTAASTNARQDESETSSQEISMRDDEEEEEDDDTPLGDMDPTCALYDGRVKGRRVLSWVRKEEKPPRRVRLLKDEYCAVSGYAAEEMVSCTRCVHSFLRRMISQDVLDRVDAAKKAAAQRQSGGATAVGGEAGVRADTERNADLGDPSDLSNHNASSTIVQSEVSNTEHTSSAGGDFVCEEARWACSRRLKPRLRRDVDPYTQLARCQVDGKKQTLVAFALECLRHEGPGEVDHVEVPQRYRRVLQLFDEKGVWDRVATIGGRVATDAELMCGGAHAGEYLRLLKARTKKLLRQDRKCYLYMDSHHDTYFCESSLEVARVAAAGAIDALDLVMTGVFRNALVLMRPPGHHCDCSAARWEKNAKESTDTTPSGFCLVNNVACAIKVLQHKHGETFKKLYGRDLKVAILDWDAHHGDGIEHIFFDDPNVLYYSQHRYEENFFPYPDGDPQCVGGENARGYNVNVPLAAGDGDLEAMTCWREIGEPVFREFKPDIVVVSAGFDAMEGDIAELNMTPRFYGWLTRKLREITQRVVVVLEGGYIPDNVARGCLFSLSALLGEDQAFGSYLAEHEVSADFRRDLETVKKIHAQYWPSIQLRAHTAHGSSGDRRTLRTGAASNAEPRSPSIRAGAH